MPEENPFYQAPAPAWVQSYACLRAGLYLSLCKYVRTSKKHKSILLGVLF